ncbi:MAG: calcium/sodium antiporter [Bacteroidales bacterium]|nr:calcium/sodium antiporter [Bacteroidales bacterium]
MLINIAYILLGLLLLVKGGDYLVDGSVAIAQRARLSRMVIGLTVVGFGTSMPELLVSLQSALMGNSGIAIGNVVGSNIANIALILGITALVHTIPTQRITLRLDLPFMLLANVLFIAVAMTGTIGRLAGIVGFLLLVAFVAYQVHNSRKASNASDEEGEQAEPMALWKALVMIIVAFAAMVFGANRLVEGASDIARQLGVTDRVIGLTIVAVGTSLPELFASVMAAVKGETDMAIGNIIGSVTFNLLCVIGLSAAITPIHGSDIGFAFDYALMFGLGILLWLFLRTSYKMVRWEGAALTAIYVAYIVKLIVLG